MENYNVKIFKFKEQDSLIDIAQTEELKKIDLKFQLTDYEGIPKYLGINNVLCASYYVGVEWIYEKDNIALAVYPKENYDFNKMFMACLESSLDPEYLSNFYEIHFDKKVINIDNLNIDITILLIVHYVCILRKIINIGLKKDYLNVVENLSSRIKGKILISPNIYTNIVKKRMDRNLCSYQIYTANIPENRLLKKALLFCQKYINLCTAKENLNELVFVFNNILQSFDNIDDNISISEVNKISGRGIFKEYKIAIELAKQILQRFDYSIKDVCSDKHTTLTFWIDMSRIYEVYVYTLLHRAYGNNIMFQVKGHYNSAVDFIMKKPPLILDTKYKPRYEKGNSKMIYDIRQLSGYARDIKILNNFTEYVNDKNALEPIPCVIIYPVKQLVEDESENIKMMNNFDGMDIIKCCQRIKSYTNFYKISVALPIL